MAYAMYAIRSEGCVIGLSSSREEAEEYVREVAEQAGSQDLVIDDDPMALEIPQCMPEPFEWKDISSNSNLLNVITYRVGNELRECCVRDYPWFAAAHAMARRTKELAGTLTPEQLEGGEDCQHSICSDPGNASYRSHVEYLHACGTALETQPKQYIESITSFYPPRYSVLRGGEAFRFLPFSPAANSVLEVVTPENLDLIAGLLLQPLLIVDSDFDIPRCGLARHLEIPRDTPLPEMRRRLSSVTLDDLRAHPRETTESIRSAKDVYDYHVAYFGDSHDFLLYDLGGCWSRINDCFKSAHDDVGRVACVMALVRLFPSLKIPSIICADAVDAVASGDMWEALDRVRRACDE